MECLGERKDAEKGLCGRKGAAEEEGRRGDAWRDTEVPSRCCCPAGHGALRCLGGPGAQEGSPCPSPPGPLSASSSSEKNGGAEQGSRPGQSPRPWAGRKGGSAGLSGGGAPAIPLLCRPSLALCAPPQPLAHNGTGEEGSVHSSLLLGRARGCVVPVKLLSPWVSCRKFWSFSFVPPLAVCVLPFTSRGALSTLITRPLCPRSWGTPERARGGLRVLAMAWTPPWCL